METEQKFKLAKTTILTLAFSIVSIVVVWLVVVHNPVSLHTVIDFDDLKIEMDCSFMNEK